jgi:hypothetical protein
VIGRVGGVRPHASRFLHLLNRLVDGLALLGGYLVRDQKLLPLQVLLVQVWRRDLWLILKYWSRATGVLSWLYRLVYQRQVWELVGTVLYQSSGSMDVELRRWGLALDVGIDQPIIDHVVLWRLDRVAPTLLRRSAVELHIHVVAFVGVELIAALRNHAQRVLGADISVEDVAGQTRVLVQNAILPVSLQNFWDVDVPIFRFADLLVQIWATFWELLMQLCPLVLRVNLILLWFSSPCLDLAALDLRRFALPLPEQMQLWPWKRMCLRHEPTVITSLPVADVAVVFVQPGVVLLAIVGNLWGYLNLNIVYLRIYLLEVAHFIL